MLYVLTAPVSLQLCEDIAKLRRKIQRHSNKRVLFLDETSLDTSECVTSTLALPGDNGDVLVEDSSNVAARYDMIACVNGDRVFPPIIYTPKDRAEAGVKGINKKMLVKYIQDILAQAIGALDTYPIILTLDRAPIHKKGILEEFHDMGCQDVKDIWLMPKQAAKRMSPLDNSLFHDWKDRCRKRGTLTKDNIEQIMSDEWNNTSVEKIKHYYKHCLLTSHHDVYADCPDPHSHAHE